MMDIVLYSLPQRRDHIRRLRESGGKIYDAQVFFQGNSQTFPVYLVDIGLPCYRLANGRTKAAQLEVIATEGLPEDFFSIDPDSALALSRQDTILRQMLSDAGLLRAFRKVQQDQSLILDSDGYVVNGNRRLCAMRLLLQQDEQTYAHFRHVQVLFLPPCSDRDIKELEGRLQVQPDIRANYSWTAEAMLYRDLRQQRWEDQEIADLYQKRVSEIRDLMAMLDDAEHYLLLRGSSGKYSQLEKKEFAFRQLQKNRRKCADDEPRKQLLASVSYLMLDDPDTADGRLYESIPDAFKFLDNIAANIRREFAEQISPDSQHSDAFEILGNAHDEIGLAGAVEALNDQANAPKARDVIRDTIEEMRNHERERRDAAYCLRQVQQAYTRLQSALSSLDEEADTTGMDDALRNIEETVSSIRDWLANADDRA